jgi:hypothetical protein
MAESVTLSRATHKYDAFYVIVQSNKQRKRKVRKTKRNFNDNRMVKSEYFCSFLRLHTKVKCVACVVLCDAMYEKLNCDARCPLPHISFSRPTTHFCDTFSQGGKSGSTRIHQDPPGSTRIHQDPPGFIRIHEDPRGSIRIQWSEIRFFPLAFSKHCSNKFFGTSTIFFSENSKITTFSIQFKLATPILGYLYSPMSRSRSTQSTGYLSHHFKAVHSRPISPRVPQYKWVIEKLPR